MTRTEIIGACGLVLVALGGAFAFGELRGEIKGLGPDRIRAAQEEALVAINDSVKSFQSSLQFTPATKTWTWNQYRNSEPVSLIPIDHGICYLVHVEGQFEGAGESVAVSQRDGHWYLDGASGRDGKDIEATAACWRFPKLRQEE